MPLACKRHVCTVGMGGWMRSSTCSCRTGEHPILSCGSNVCVDAWPDAAGRPTEHAVQATCDLPGFKLHHSRRLTFLPPGLLLFRYLTAIQLTSQHLLRYLAVAVVVNKRE